MPSFRYQALSGEGQLVTGELDAENVQQAVAQLEDQGLLLQSIGLVDSWAPTLPSDSASSNFRVAADTSPPTQPTAGESLERSVLRSHLAAILEHGKVIAPALTAYAEELPAGRQRRQLQAVCRILSSGNADEATAGLLQVPECWIPLLSAATLSADPGHVLSEFLTESRRIDNLRQKWWLALAYPVLLAGLALVVLVALSVFVIPEFAAIFNEFDMALPGLTLFVVNLGAWLSSTGGLLIAVLAVALFVLLLGASRLLPSGALGWFSDRFRVPFSRRTSAARLARFTADLLEAGIGLPDALRIAGFAVQRSSMQQAAWNLAHDLERSDRRHDTSSIRPLTATVAHALRAEMSPTARVRLLRDVATCHAERVELGLSWTSGIVEPFAICLVGLVVGTVVLALFLPLVKLIEGLSG